MILTTQIKLIIIAVVVAVVGYSYYWTYDQGRKNGKAQEITVQYEALKKALKQNDLENKALRERELREARKIADDFAAYHKRTVHLYENAIDSLKKAPPDYQVCLIKPLPDNFVELLNSPDSTGDS